MTTYDLLPALEKMRRAGEERTHTPLTLGASPAHAGLEQKLAELAPRMYDTLLLCEDALTELGRTDDGTPSIQALMDIQVIKKEAGYLLLEEIQSMERAFHKPPNLSGREDGPKQDIDLER